MTRPLKPSEVHYWVNKYTSDFAAAELKATKGQKGAVRKYLVAAIPNPEDRHAVYGFLFSPRLAEPFQALSSKTFSDAQWLALKRWIGASLENDPITGEGEWEADPAWAQEITWCLWEAHNMKLAPWEDGEMGQDPNERLNDPYPDRRVTEQIIAAALQKRETEPAADESMVNASIELGGKVVEVMPAAENPLYIAPLTPPAAAPIARARRAAFKFDA